MSFITPRSFECYPEESCDSFASNVTDCEDSNLVDAINTGGDESNACEDVEIPPASSASFNLAASKLKPYCNDDGTTRNVPASSNHLPLSSTEGYSASTNGHSQILQAMQRAINERGEVGVQYAAYTPRKVQPPPSQVLETSPFQELKELLKETEQKGQNEALAKETIVVAPSVKTVGRPSNDGSYQDVTMEIHESKPSRLTEDVPRLEIIEEPEETYRARYESEGCRGPIHGETENSYPTVKVVGYVGDVVMVVFLVTKDGEPHLHSVNGPGSTKCHTDETKLQDDIPGIQMYLGEAQDMTAVWDCLSVRRIRNWEADRLLRMRGIDPSTWKNKKKEARLMFQVSIPPQPDKHNGFILTCQSRTFLCTAPSGSPEIWWTSLTEGSPKGGEEMGIIGKKFSSGFRVRFFCYGDDGFNWEAYGEIDRQKSHQGACVVKTPAYKDPESTTSTTVNIEIRVGSDKDPRCSDPVIFTYRTKPAPKALEEGCQNCSKFRVALQHLFQTSPDSSPMSSAPRTRTSSDGSTRDEEGPPEKICAKQTQKPQPMEDDKPIQPELLLQPPVSTDASAEKSVTYKVVVPTTSVMAIRKDLTPRSIAVPMATHGGVRIAPVATVTPQFSLATVPTVPVSSLPLVRQLISTPVSISHVQSLAQPVQVEAQTSAVFPPIAACQSAGIRLIQTNCVPTIASLPNQQTRYQIVLNPQSQTVVIPKNTNLVNVRLSQPGTPVSVASVMSNNIQPVSSGAFVTTVTPIVQPPISRPLVITPSAKPQPEKATNMEVDSPTTTPTPSTTSAAVNQPPLGQLQQLLLNMPQALQSHLKSSAHELPPNYMETLATLIRQLKSVVSTQSLSGSQPVANFNNGTAALTTLPASVALVSNAIPGNSSATVPLSLQSIKAVDTSSNMVNFVPNFALSGQNQSMAQTGYTLALEQELKRLQSVGQNTGSLSATNIAILQQQQYLLEQQRIALEQKLKMQQQAQQEVQLRAVQLNAAQQQSSQQQANQQQTAQIQATQQHAAQIQATQQQVAQLQATQQQAAQLQATQPQAAHLQVTQQQVAQAQASQQVAQLQASQQQVSQAQANQAAQLQATHLQQAQQAQQQQTTLQPNQQPSPLQLHQQVQEIHLQAKIMTQEAHIKAEQEAQLQAQQQAQYQAQQQSQQQSQFNIHLQKEQLSQLQSQGSQVFQTNLQGNPLSHQQLQQQIQLQTQYQGERQESVQGQQQSQQNSPQQHQQASPQSNQSDSQQPSHVQVQYQREQLKTQTTPLQSIHPGQQLLQQNRHQQPQFQTQHQLIQHQLLQELQKQAQQQSSQLSQQNIPQSATQTQFQNAPQYQGGTLNQWDSSHGFEKTPSHQQVESDAQSHASLLNLYQRTSVASSSLISSILQPSRLQASLQEAANQNSSGMNKSQQPPTVVVKQEQPSYAASSSCSMGEKVVYSADANANTLPNNPVFDTMETASSKAEGNNFSEHSSFPGSQSPSMYLNTTCYSTEAVPNSSPQVSYDKQQENTNSVDSTLPTYDTENPQSNVSTFSPPPNVALSSFHNDIAQQTPSVVSAVNLSQGHVFGGTSTSASVQLTPATTVSTGLKMNFGNYSDSKASTTDQARPETFATDSAGLEYSATNETRYDEKVSFEQNIETSSNFAKPQTPAMDIVTSSGKAELWNAATSFSNNATDFIQVSYPSLTPQPMSLTEDPIFDGVQLNIPHQASDSYIYASEDKVTTGFNLDGTKCGGENNMQSFGNGGSGSAQAGQGSYGVQYLSNTETAGVKQMYPYNEGGNQLEESEKVLTNSAGVVNFWNTTGDGGSLQGVTPGHGASVAEKEDVVVKGHTVHWLSTENPDNTFDPSQFMNQPKPEGSLPTEFSTAKIDGSSTVENAVTYGMQQQQQPINMSQHSATMDFSTEAGNPNPSQNFNAIQTVDLTQSDIGTVGNDSIMSGSAILGDLTSQVDVQTSNPGTLSNTEKYFAPTGYEAMSSVQSGDWTQGHVPAASQPNYTTDTSSLQNSEKRQDTTVNAVHNFDGMRDQKTIDMNQGVTAQEYAQLSQQAFESRFGPSHFGGTPHIQSSGFNIDDSNEINDLKADITTMFQSDLLTPDEVQVLLRSAQQKDSLLLEMYRSAKGEMPTLDSLSLTLKHWLAKKGTPES